MMDEKLQAKLQRAFDQCYAEALQRGLSSDQTLQLVADFLINHPDRELREFQERHSRQVRRDLN
jgi:hypothetical protein